MIRESAERYLESLKGSKTVNTILSYKQDLLQYCDYLEAAQADAAQAQATQAQAALVGLEPARQARSYVDFMLQTMAPSSVARKMSVLNCFFEYCISSGEMQDNPMKEIKPPRVEGGVVKKLTEDETRKLAEMPKGYSAKAVRDRAMMAVMADTGYKTSRIIGLELSDADALGISKKTRELLDDYIYGSRYEFAGETDCGKLFINYAGGPLSRQGFWKIVRSYRERTEHGAV